VTTACRLVGVPPEDALRAAANRLRARIRAVERSSSKGVE
jgi:hypothetical protein